MVAVPGGPLQKAQDRDAGFAVFRQRLKGLALVLPPVSLLLKASSKSISGSILVLSYGSSRSRWMGRRRRRSTTKCIEVLGQFPSTSISGLWGEGKGAIEGEEVQRKFVDGL